MSKSPEQEDREFVRKHLHKFVDEGIADPVDAAELLLKMSSGSDLRRVEKKIDMLAESLIGLENKLVALGKALKIDL